MTPLPLGIIKFELTDTGNIIPNTCGFVPRQDAPALCGHMLWTGMKADRPICCRDLEDGRYQVCELEV